MLPPVVLAILAILRDGFANYTRTSLTLLVILVQFAIVDPDLTLSFVLALSPVFSHIFVVRVCLSVCFLARRIGLEAPAVPK